MSRKISFSSKDISDRMIFRLTEYLRLLKEELKISQTINSVELAEKMNSTAAQVRKDLSTFGEFGTRGKGYDISELIKILENILGVDKENELILVGYGKMGSMLVSNNVVLGKNFKIIGIFDKDKSKLGKKAEGIDLEIQSMSSLNEFTTENNVTQAILAVNSDVAQSVTETLVKSGIKGILNLTAFKITVPQDVAVIDVDISSKLQELNFWRRYFDLKNES